MKLLECKSLSLGYDGKEVVGGLSFCVSEGDYLCIIGENGSGKSTLMKALLGLITPLGGDIELCGLKNSEIGYLPQQTLVQRDFPASVQEIVLSGFVGKSSLKPFYRKEQKEIAARNMKKMGVYDIRNKCYRELSGGQQQRVLLARALCAAKKLILLDEPTAGLDPRVTGELYRLIAEINGEGTTVIMISHDISAAVKYASHILFIDKETFFGTKHEYMHSSFASNFSCDCDEETI